MPSEPETELLARVEAKRRALGKRPDVYHNVRLAEAKRITQLLLQEKQFSLGRIGDYDVALLLWPEEAAEKYNASLTRTSGTQAAGSPGLGADQVPRLRAALEKVKYLDYHELLWNNDTLLRQLALKRPASSLRNPSRETSYILPTWLVHEFKQYCHGKRILFCGAEAPLLRELSKTKAFQDASRAVWPENIKPFFLRPREDGKNLCRNLDRIKSDLLEITRREKIDTVFLSLGGGAKILAAEIAEETEVRVIDFGVGMRSLTYCGSDGQGASRSTHLVYLYHIPFRCFMDALEKAFPGMDEATVLAKAHAQLILEVQEKELGWSHSAWEYEFSAENLIAFRNAFNEYKKRYRHLFRRSAGTVKERREFLHFCGTHGLTFEGKLFLKWFHFKGWIKNILKW